MKIGLSLLFSIITSSMLFAQQLFIETESFDNKGGWVVDQQFMDQMGSPYLMAHGLGKPVSDASTQITLPEIGMYNIYIRTYNWTSPWYQGDGPGKFQLLVNNKVVGDNLGIHETSWQWVKAGVYNAKEITAVLSLKDLTGFNGRCDAICFSKDELSVDGARDSELDQLRVKMSNSDVLKCDSYDFVVVGGGIAGMSAALAAARLGSKVALIHNRPVLGGNNSSEVRVHLGGRIEAKPYIALGNLQKEFGPEKGGNAQPASFYEDKKKMDVIKSEKNIDLYVNMHAYKVICSNNKIEEIDAIDIENGTKYRFKAPVFADCTGDGTIGYLAGASYMMGRESKEMFKEPTAPLVGDTLVMGSSVQWYSEKSGEEELFPEFSYGVSFNPQNAEPVTMGEWTWETGMHLNQITQAEVIRDYGLLVVFSNWSVLKNDPLFKDKYNSRKLAWVAYIAGKRESRRLIGDHILTENDIRNFVEYPDGTGSTTWSIDLHYPDSVNKLKFPDNPFKSVARHIPIYPYPIPYRCLYSKDIKNLFMAGRNISVSHVALGTVRVMRTTGILGEVVGMAASLCVKYKAVPRQVYTNHLDELKGLMRVGVGQNDLPNNQQYNEGATLLVPPRPYTK